MFPQKCTAGTNRIHATPADMEHARQEMEEAVKRSPSFGKAIAALARLYTVMGIQKQIDSKTAFDKAIQLDERAIQLQPDLADAHTVKALLFFYHMNFEQAIAEARRATELDRNNAITHSYLALFPATRGHTREAQNEMNKALSLDPYRIPPHVTDLYLADLSRDHAGI